MYFKHLLIPAELKYDAKKELGPFCYSFNFVASKPLTWKAGQYALLEIKSPDGSKRLRPFSIASAPGESVVTIATKIDSENQDDFKQALFNLKKGSLVKFRGPIGRMYIKNYSKNYAFLTTGIGITTFRSILKQLVLDGRLDTKITLFFVGNKDTHYFKDELTSLKSALRNFNIDYIYKPDRITGQTVEEVIGKDLDSTIYFLSGSSNLIKSYRRTLMGLGISPKNIKSNNFRDFSRDLIKKELAGLNEKL